MLTVLNGGERTAAAYKSLFEQSGWRLVRIESQDNVRSMDTKIVGVPQ